MIANKNSFAFSTEGKPVNWILISVVVDASDLFMYSDMSGSDLWLRDDDRTQLPPVALSGRLFSEQWQAVTSGQVPVWVMNRATAEQGRRRWGATRRTHRRARRESGRPSPQLGFCRRYSVISRARRRHRP